MTALEAMIRGVLSLDELADTRRAAATDREPGNLRYAPFRLLALLNAEREKGRRIIALIQHTADALRDVNPDQCAALGIAARLVRDVLA